MIRDKDLAHNIYNSNERKSLGSCTLCPRECRVNRFEAGNGYCATNAGFNIASICIHRGEEPVISGEDGICNIFFSGCNLRCIYCQNHDISHCIKGNTDSLMDYDSVIKKVISILDKGITAVGFVSPSHVVPQVKAIIRGLNSKGHKPVTVYNTSGYDKPETIRGLSGMIDVYLPDFKYVTTEISGAFSDAYNYPGIALKAIREMYYQKGSILSLDERGRAESGLLIRHLVLPGYAEESKKVLRTIAEELSPGIHLSLMSQYHPAAEALNHTELNRTLYREEYRSVVESMESLGFRNGWIQDMDSHENYRPDFSREDPFE